MTENATAIREQDFYFVIQRAHELPGGKTTWVDSSSKYYYEPGRVAALAQRDEMREIFGEDQVRVVRCDVLVTESVEG